MEIALESPAAVLIANADPGMLKISIAPALIRIAPGLAGVPPLVLAVGTVQVNPAVLVPQTMKASSGPSQVMRTLGPSVGTV